MRSLRQLGSSREVAGRRRSAAMSVPGPLLLLLLLFGCQDQPQVSRVDALQQLREIAPQEIPLDDSEGQPSLSRNFYFIVDGSGSMARDPGGDCEGDQSFDSKLEGAKWAVSQMLDKLPEDTNIGLYVFDDGGSREVVPLDSGNRDRFRRAVEAIDAGGGTPLAHAIREGTGRLVERYKAQLGYGEFRLVVVTDGLAGEIPGAALDAARYGMPIYAIGLCIGEDHPLRAYAVSYRAADSFEDLARGLEETLAELPSYDPQQFEGLR